MTDSGKRKKLTRYQSFPDQDGGSLSFEKLKKLRLPSLAGKTFMDVGCNEGFFCGYAKFDGASRVVGIDMNADFLERARHRFPDCEFLHQEWDTLPEEKFDVILLASALHYASDQADLISRLVDRLAPNGTLVLELGVFSAPENEWIPVKRSIDTRCFPTWKKLNEVLQGHAWKYVAQSVMQTGDPVGRFVVHVRRRLPFAYLLMMPPSFGKTYISRELFTKIGIPIVMGDMVLENLANGKGKTTERFSSFLSKSYVSGEAARVVGEIFTADLADDFISAWQNDAGPSDFAFEGFIPTNYQNRVMAQLRHMGYLPVRLTWELPGEILGSPDRPQAAAKSYFDLLAKGASAQPVAAAKSKAGGVSSPLAAVVPAPLRRENDGLNWLKKVSCDPSPPSESKVRLRWKSEGNMGFVDSVKVSGQTVSVRGWAINKAGLFPKLLVFTIGGNVISKENINPVPRQDVQRAIGIDNVKLGFSIELGLEAPLAPQEILSSLSIRCGDTPGDLSGNFRISPKIVL